MRINLWGQFEDLLGSRPRILGTVTAHNVDGTSSLTTYDGASLRAWGRVEGLEPPYNAFVRDGKIEAQAPNLTLLQLDV